MNKSPSLRDGTVGYAKLLDVKVTNNYYSVANLMFDRTCELLYTTLDRGKFVYIVTTIFEECDVTDEERIFVGDLFQRCLSSIIMKQYCLK